MQPIINIEKKYFFIFLGLISAGLIISVSQVVQALSQSEVLKQSPAYHLLKDIYTIINGEYVQLNTSEGYINASLIRGDTLRIEDGIAWPSNNPSAVYVSSANGDAISAYSSASGRSALYAVAGGTNTYAGYFEGGLGVSVDNLKIRNKVSCGKLYTDANGNVKCGSDAVNDSVDSSELDNLCGTNGKILKRINGRWQCADDQTGITSCSSCDSRFVNTAGDSMTGNLNMKDHDVKDVDTLETNTIKDPEDAWVYVDDNLEVNGKVKGSQLCIGSDCRSSWPSGGECVHLTKGKTSPHGYLSATISLSCPPGYIIVSACTAACQRPDYHSIYEAEGCAVFNCHESTTHSCVGESSCSFKFGGGTENNDAGYMAITCCKT